MRIYGLESIETADREQEESIPWQVAQITIWNLGQFCSRLKTIFCLNFGQMEIIEG